MKLFKSKWLVYLAVPCILYLGYYFHKPIVCYGIKKKLCSYQPQLKGAKVSYKKLLFKDKAFEIRDLRVKDPALAHLKNAPDLLYIKKVKCHLMLKAFPFKCKTFISVQSPEISLVKQNTQKKKKEIRLYKTLSSLRAARKIQIKKGSIELLGEDLTPLINAHFSYTPSAIVGEVGSFSLRFFEDKGECDASLSLKNYKACLNFNCRKIYLEETETIAKFFGIQESSFSASQGFIQGEMSFEIARDNTLRAFRSDAKACNIAIQSNGVYFAADLLSLETFLPHEKRLSLKKLPLALLAKELVTSFEMGKAQLYYVNPLTKTKWQLSDFTGKASFNHQTMPNLYFSALMQKDEKKYPVSLAAKGWIDTEKSYWMDFDLTLQSESHAGKHTSFYLALLDTDHYFAKTTFSALNDAEIHLYQDLLTPFFPRLKNLKVNSGSLSGDFSLELKHQKIESISLEHAEIQDFCASFEDWIDIQKIKEAKGKFKLYYPLLDPKKPHSCDFVVKDALVSVKNNDTSHLFENISFEASSRNFEVNHGSFHCRYLGIDTDFFAKGPFTNLDIQSQLTLAKEHVFSEYQNDVLNVTGGISPLKRVESEIKLKVLEKKLNLITDHSMYFENEVEDTLCVGMSFDKSSELKQMFSLSFWKDSLTKGWFKTDKISEHSYLWITTPFKPKWNTKGNVQARGKFDSQNLSFVLRSNKAVYDSDDLMITLISDVKPYVGNFAYDSYQDRWDIEIPIEGAQCIDKRYQIPFYDVGGVIQIHGTDLRAENLIAKSENVQFAGRLDLDFKNPDWLDLKLYPTEIEGSVEDFMCFLRYLPDFKDFNYPIQGKIKSSFNNTLFTQYNQEESVKSTKVFLEVSEASYKLSDSFSISDASCCLFFDSEKNEMEIKDLVGKVNLAKEYDTRSYSLASRYLHTKNFDQMQWEFDLRLEAKTHDVMRLAGSTVKKEGDLEFLFEKNLSHFYGAKLFCKECVVDSDFRLKNIHIKSNFSSVDLFNQIQFLHLGGFLDMKPSLYEDLKNTKTEGDISLLLSYDKEEQGFQVEVESRALLFDKLLIEDLSINACKNRHHFVLQKCNTKNFSAIAVAERQEVDWKIPVFEIHYKDSYVTTSTGDFKTQTSTLHLDLEKLKVSLTELCSFSSSANFNPFEGTLQGSAVLSVDFSNGIKQAKALSSLKIFSEDFTSAKCKLTSIRPVQMSFSLDEGIVFEDLRFGVKHKEHEHLQFSLDASSMQLFPFSKSFSGKSVKLSIPPEVVLFLAKQNSLASISECEGRLEVAGKQFVWDNQIETELDFSFEKGALTLGGLLKEGYYWIGEKSVYLQNIRYVYEKDKFNFACGVDYQNASFDLVTKIQLEDDLQGVISLKEGHSEDYEERGGVQIQCRLTDDEGFFIQSAVGEIYGLDFSLQRNPRSYVPHVMILTGQIKIDTFSLVKAFPELFYQTFKELGMGSGYELSGDWVFSKKDLLSSHFKGFLKGRDFEFLGFYFKTLLSEIDVSSRGMTVHDFSLSDKSGVCQIKEAKILKDEESNRWKMSIPEVTVQDFRPSFLKKNYGEEEQIKPFMIRDMHFFNIQGFLGEKESFTGRGYLDFINTFKRDYNLLDIPIEIIGRIGFDLGLFIPVRGKLEFDMKEGKVFFNELVNTFSEGKRSRFYLASPGDSYIDLDGTMCIDVKMKQYVLLKITEPFTLLIRGTLDKPKYSLK